MLASRGRGEVIKLSFVLASAEYDLIEPNRAEMKTDMEGYLFGENQCRTAPPNTVSLS